MFLSRFYLTNAGIKKKIFFFFYFPTDPLQRSFFSSENCILNEINKNRLFIMEPANSTFFKSAQFSV